MVAHDYAVMIVDQVIPYGGPEQAATVDDGSAHLSPGPTNQARLPLH